MCLAYLSGMFEHHIKQYIWQVKCEMICNIMCYSQLSRWKQYWNFTDWPKKFYAFRRHFYLKLSALCLWRQIEKCTRVCWIPQPSLPAWHLALWSWDAWVLVGSSDLLFMSWPLYHHNWNEKTQLFPSLRCSKGKKKWFKFTTQENSEFTK